MNILVEIKDGRIWLYTPYKLKDICKALPGRRWNKKRRAWSVDATPACAAAVRDAFSGFEINGREALEEIAEKHGHATGLRDLGEDVPEVKAYITTPWTHQKRAVHMITRQQATMLAYDMGTGKTKCVIDAICNLEDCRRVLVICPSTVVDVWPAEFNKHAARPCKIRGLLRGSVAARTHEAEMWLEWCEKHDQRFVAVINYEAAWREPFASFAKAVEWDMIVCDESHRIKAPGGRQSRFIATLRDRAARRVCLTGTPMPHSPLDVYAQFRFLDPGIYGSSFTVFRSRYARMGGYGNHQVLGYQNLDDLHDRFYSIADRVMKADVLDLPPFVHSERMIDLKPDTQRAYNELEDQFVADVQGGEVTAKNALSKMLRLQQMTSGYAAIDNGDGTTTETQLGAEKEAELATILSEDLPADQPVVVFVRFIHDLEAVCRSAEKAGRQCYRLSGQWKELAPWQAATDGSVIAVQIQAGGLGVDLSRAAYCVFYSLNHSLGDFDQALARCHRHGQTQSVTYIHLIARNSIDTKIYSALQRRADVVRSVLEGYGNE